MSQRHELLKQLQRSRAELGESTAQAREIDGLLAFASEPVEAPNEQQRATRLEAIVAGAHAEKQFSLVRSSLSTDGVPPSGRPSPFVVNFIEVLPAGAHLEPGRDEMAAVLEAWQECPGVAVPLRSAAAFVARELLGSVGCKRPVRPSSPVSIAALDSEGTRAAARIARSISMSVRTYERSRSLIRRAKQLMSHTA